MVGSVQRKSDNSWEITATATWGPHREKERNIKILHQRSPSSLTWAHPHPHPLSISKSRSWSRRIWSSVNLVSQETDPMTESQQLLKSQNVHPHQAYYLVLWQPKIAGSGLRMLQQNSQGLCQLVDPTGSLHPCTWSMLALGIVPPWTPSLKS